MKQTRIGEAIKIIRKKGIQITRSKRNPKNFWMEGHECAPGEVIFIAENINRIFDKNDKLEPVVEVPDGKG